ncbi:hypothetical protein TRVA0_002S03400 [Trichomonascus vanleenenianus]|uniref:uncharacterized protein n=1 Tax=Trichomonascus vanleenenianus TaxID=2268995 RepID=UPI003ECAA19A
MESLLVDIASFVYTAVSVVVDTTNLRPVFETTTSPTAQRVPLTNEELEGYYIRRERSDRNRIANIFDHNGQKIYTFERKSRLSPIWSMLSCPDRREIATVFAGMKGRHIDFHSKPGLQHRKLFGVRKHLRKSRQFYLNDGAAYEWSRPTKYLERIINPGGGDEEVRERIAKARLMRQFKFDYEIVMDPTKIDRDVVLATGFISIITQWGYGNQTSTRGPTYIPKNLKCGPKLASIEAYQKIQEAQPQEYEYDEDDVEVQNRVFLVLDNGQMIDQGSSVDLVSKKLLELTNGAAPSRRIYESSPLSEIESELEEEFVEAQ